MTARQFLLNESLYCRRKAERCGDPFIAVELRRLAEAFEQKAEDGCLNSPPVARPETFGVRGNFSSPRAHKTRSSRWLAGDSGASGR